MNRRSGIAALATLLAALLLPLAASSTAVAADTAAVGTVEYAPECLVQAAVHGVDREVCRVETGISVSGSRSVTVAQARAVTGLTQIEKTQLVAAAAAGTIRSKTYNQWVTGGGYSRTQKGTWYYNGSKAWVTVAYSGYTGSHNCLTNYAIGATITGTACSESGTTFSRNMYSSWEVKILNITYGHDMHMYVKGDGTASGTNVTTG